MPIKKLFTPIDDATMGRLFLTAYRDQPLDNNMARTDVAENIADHVAWRARYNPRARRLILRYQKGVATITLPRFTQEAHVKKFLQNSLGWLLQEVEKEKKFQQDNWLQHGGAINILGKKKILQWMTGNGRVKDTGDNIIVPAPPRHHETKLKKYLWRVAEEKFPAVVEHYCQKLSLPMPEISIRDPKSRWGSCIQQKHFLYGDRARIMLSFRLTLAPPLVLAYLAAHEVCHLQESNHGKNFWDLVARIFPNYEVAEEWLKTEGKTLMKLF